MTTWSAVTWDTARAGGFAAYILLSLAVSVGLVLRNRWQTPKWPRLITNELHGYLSLLALVFIVVHVLAVLVDPFTHFGLAEVLVPLVSHYRPVWMGLGIVALYLLLAVWVSSRLRRASDTSTWRRIHVLAYGVYVAATIHGLGTGSDTRSGLGTDALRVQRRPRRGADRASAARPRGPGSGARPVLAALASAVIVSVAIWALVGPLAAHWGARAGGRPGNRQAAVSAQVGRSPSSTVPAGAVTSDTLRRHVRGSSRRSAARRERQGDDSHRRRSARWHRRPPGDLPPWRAPRGRWCRDGAEPSAHGHSDPSLPGRDRRSPRIGSRGLHAIDDPSTTARDLAEPRTRRVGERQGPWNQDVRLTRLDRGLQGLTA